MKLEYIIAGFILCLVLFIVGVLLLTSCRLILPVRLEEFLGLLTISVAIIVLGLFLIIIGYK